MDEDRAVSATFDAIPVPPSLSPPSLLSVGKAQALAGKGQVKGNKALVKLRCRAEIGQHCKGVLKLFAQVKQRKNGKKKNVLIGKSRFGLAAGQSKTIKVKIINSRVKWLLRKGKSLKVMVKGTGVKLRSVWLRATST